ncbi:MAG: hypothetical protein NW207_09900 [Cytophagales bacterium]|nr:hypothetical protein [Cytophagales bacterium]
MKHIILIISLITTHIGIHAQPLLQATANSPDKVLQSELMVYNNDTKGSFEDGHGKKPYLKALGQPPKKVALLSFYLFDPITSVNWDGRSFCMYSESNFTDEGHNKIANKFLDTSMAQLKEAFKTYGMELLTPAEYLTDDAKREAYDKFANPHSGLPKFLVSDKKFKNASSPDGYRSFIIQYPDDNKASEEFGKLAKTLEVDAVVIIGNDILCESKSFQINKLGIYMYGPNPVPKKDDATYTNKHGMGYHEGHMYVGFELDLGGSIFVKHKKGAITWQDYSGYDKLCGFLIKNIGEFLTAATNNK